MINVRVGRSVIEWSLEIGANGNRSVWPAVDKSNKIDDINDDHVTVHTKPTTARLESKKKKDITICQADTAQGEAINNTKVTNFEAVIFMASSSR